MAHFVKGEIVEYDFPQKKKGSKVICDTHRAVVLYSRSTPYNTTTIAPITSAGSLRKAGQVPENYISIAQSDYPLILTHDSYINLDMMIAVDSSAIQSYCNDKGIVVKQKLNAEDINNLDYGIALSYELQTYLNQQINDEYENVIEYIDTEIRTKINRIMGMISDPDVLQLLRELLEKDLLTALVEGKKEFES